MRTSVQNVFAAGDITLAHNLVAGRAVAAEHWRDAAQQGLIAGLTAAGFPAAWDKVPGFSCTIGAFTLKYRGWGGAYGPCTVTDRRDGFTATYRAPAGSSGRWTLQPVPPLEHHVQRRAPAATMSAVLVTKPRDGVDAGIVARSARRSR